MFWSIFWVVYIWGAVCAFIAICRLRKADIRVYRLIDMAGCILWAALWPTAFLYIILDFLWNEGEKMAFIEITEQKTGKPMMIRLEAIDTIQAKEESNGGGVVMHIGKYEYHVDVKYRDIKSLIERKLR